MNSLPNPAKSIAQKAIARMVAQARPGLSIGLVAMVSYSIVHRMRPRTFIADAAEAGIDGLIIPDLPLEESEPVRNAAAEAGITCSFLVSPSTPLDRARALATASSGFVYLLARSGITGEQRRLPEDLPLRIEQIRKVTDLGKQAHVVASADYRIIDSMMIDAPEQWAAAGGSVIGIGGGM